MGVASGCGEQEVGVASGSEWNLWVWLLGVVLRRYIDFLILLIPTPLVSVLFCSNIPTFLFILKMFFVLVPVLLIIYNYTNLYTRVVRLLYMILTLYLSPVYFYLFKKINFMVSQYKNKRSEVDSEKDVVIETLWYCTVGILK